MTYPDTARQAAPEDGDRLLKISECAELYSVNPRTVERLIGKGRLPAVRIGKLVRVRLSAARAFIQEAENAS